MTVLDAALDTFKSLGGLLNGIFQVDFELGVGQEAAF